MGNLKEALIKCGAAAGRYSTTEQEAVATWPFRQTQLEGVTGLALLGTIKTI